MKMLESKYKKLQKTYRKSEIKFHGQVYDKSLELKELFLEAVKTLYGCSPNNKFKRWISIHQM